MIVKTFHQTSKTLISSCPPTRSGHFGGLFWPFFVTFFVAFFAKTPLCGCKIFPYGKKILRKQAPREVGYSLPTT